MTRVALVFGRVFGVVLLLSLLASMLTPPLGSMALLAFIGGAIGAGLARWRRPRASWTVHLAWSIVGALAVTVPMAFLATRNADAFSTGVLQGRALWYAILAGSGFTLVGTGSRKSRADAATAPPIVPPTTTPTAASPVDQRDDADITT